MKTTVLLLGLLLLGGATTTAAQTRFRGSVGFWYPRPYVSGFVFVGPPRPFVGYRRYARPWPRVVVLEPPYYVERFSPRPWYRHRHYYRRAARCWRCGY